MMRTEDYSHSFQLLLKQCTPIENGDIKQVHDWCKEHNIRAIFVGSNYGKNIWFVEDEQSRVLFTLRWV